MKLTGRRFIAFAAPLVVLAALAAGIWRARSEIVPFSRQPVAVMSTETTLTVLARRDQKQLAERALEAAERVLRDVEARMSAHLDGSELSRLNAAGAGEAVELSAPTLQVLRLASQYASATRGAFDVTCRPVIQLWKQCSLQGRMPTQQEIDAARALVGADKLLLTDSAAAKALEGVGVDLGGIAKKLAIDLAAEEMAKSGAALGIVNVGGDIRFIGQRPEGPWRVEVRDPFGRDGPLAVIHAPGGAVCTSGNYERSRPVASRLFSHIVDPRSGMALEAGAAESVASVTVVSEKAVDGVWATALSVLGRDGLELLPAGVEAMIVTGSADSYRVDMTDGFRNLLAGPVQAGGTD